MSGAPAMHDDDPDIKVAALFFVILGVAGLLLLGAGVAELLSWVRGR